MKMHVRIDHVIFILIIILIILALVTSCSKVEFLDSDGPVNTDGQADETPMANPLFWGTTFEVSYQAGVLAEKVDVLIAVDTSGSMRFEQAEMARRFANFIDTLSGLDWQVALTTMSIDNGSEVGSDGMLIPFDEQGLVVLKKDTPNAEQLFEQAVRRPIFCNRGECQNQERGIYNVNRTIERQVGLNRQAEQQFFRKGAALNIIMVTDEDEGSNASNLEDLDMPNRLRENVLTLIKPASFIVHSIIARPDDLSCTTGRYHEQKFGTTYYELSRLTGGIVGSVCEDDYTKQLKDIGSRITQDVHAVQLPCAPTVNSLKVIFTPKIFFGWYLDQQKIIFESNLPAETSVKITGICSSIQTVDWDY